MGVQGLWKLVEPCGRLVPLEAMSNKVLAIDVSIWLHQAMQGMHDVQGAPVAIAPLLVLFHRLCKLLFYKIKPVFVFDGGVPTLKRQTMASRRMKKSSARSEVSKVRGKLLKNLLKHEALRQVLTDQTATAVLGLNSLHLPGPAEDEDLYKLPAVATASTYSESSGAEDSEEEEEDLGGEIVDIHSLDVKSPAFLALSAEARHDILSDIKDTRKQSSWRNIDQMPQQSQDFSQFQMQRLLKRRQVQVCLEECGKEMGARDVSMQELQGMLGGFTAGSVVTGRVAQEDHTKFMLVQKPKNLPMIPETSGAKPVASNTLIGTSEGFDITNHLEDVQWSSDSEGEIEKRLNSPSKSNQRDGYLRPNQLPLSQILVNDTISEIAAVLAEGLEPDEKIDLKMEVPPTEVTDLRNLEIGESSLENKVKGEEKLLETAEKIGLKMEVTTTGNKVNMEIEEIEVKEEDEKEKLSDDSQVIFARDTPMAVDDEMEQKESLVLTPDSVNLDVVKSEPKLVNVELVSAKNVALESVKEKAFKMSLRAPSAEISDLEDRKNCESKSEEKSLSEEIAKKSPSAAKALQIAVSDSKNVLPIVIEKPNNEVENAKLLEARRKILEGLQNQLKKPTPLFGFGNGPDTASQPRKEEMVDSERVEVEDNHTHVHIYPKNTFTDPPKQEQTEISDSTAEPPQNTRETSSHSDVSDLNTDDSGITSSAGPVSSQNPLSTTVEVSSVGVSAETFICEEISDLKPEKSEKRETEEENNSAVFDEASDTDSDFVEVNDSPPTPTPTCSDQDAHESDSIDAESSPEKVNKMPKPEPIAMEKMTEEEMINLQKELESERDGLMSEKGRQERLAQNVSDQMYQDAQELLQLFGVPFIVAPMEAEAQCAALDLLGLTHGTITDDSDIWLFGGTTVYKNFFNQKKHVLEFRSDDLKQYFKLDREELVRLALLVGSDYTTGLAGVGPVTALEVLAAFPSRTPGQQTPTASDVDGILQGMRRFQQWLASGFTVGPTKVSLKNKLKNTHLIPSFPSGAVVEAYLRPEVDDSREPFSWSRPSLQLLEKYTSIKFGWTAEKCRELLLPVMKKMLETTEQPTLDRYFRTVQPTGLLEGKLSKRVEGAIKRLGAPTSDLDEEQPSSSRVKKPRVMAIKSKGDLASKPAASSLLDPLTQRLHSETIIPQRQQDCRERLEKKQRAAEILKRGKGRGQGRGQPRFKTAPHQAKVNLSESDSD